nr:MAG TPA: hypothetical protein [Caudoviricetes sp.]
MKQSTKEYIIIFVMVFFISFTLFVGGLLL